MISLDDILSIFGLTEARLPAPLRRGAKALLVVALLTGGHRVVVGQWIWNWTNSLYRADPPQFLDIAGILVVVGLLVWPSLRLRELSKQAEPKTAPPARYRAQYSRGDLLWYAWIEPAKGPPAEVQSFCPMPCLGAVRSPEDKKAYCLRCGREYGTHAEYLNLLSDIHVAAQGDWRIRRRGFVDDAISPITVYIPAEKTVSEKPKEVVRVKKYRPPDPYLIEGVLWDGTVEESPEGIMTAVNEEPLCPRCPQRTILLPKHTNRWLRFDCLTCKLSKTINYTEQNTRAKRQRIYAEIENRLRNGFSRDRAHFVEVS